MMTKQVVVVCMIDSVHTARWLENFRDQGINFHLFPSTPNRRVHPQIRELLNISDQNSSRFFLNPLSRWCAIPMWCADIVLGNRVRGYLVSRMVRRIEATHLHAMELNHAGKISVRALKKLNLQGIPGV